MTEPKEFMVGNERFLATHIPTATADMWIVIHDEGEAFSVVLMDLRGNAVRWIDPPPRQIKGVENAVKEAFGLGKV